MYDTPSVYTTAISTIPKNDLRCVKSFRFGSCWEPTTISLLPWPQLKLTAYFEVYALTKEGLQADLRLVVCRTVRSCHYMMDIGKYVYECTIWGRNCRHARPTRLCLHHQWHHPDHTSSNDQTAPLLAPDHLIKKGEN